MEAKNKLPELLAPCGSPEAVDAAISGGADAVYFGGTMFNARMNAKNFSRDDTVAAINKCHEHGLRAYITFNTRIYDRELASALEYASFLYEAGADALIIADLGAAELIRRHIPKFELHASTQMTINNVAGAKLLSKLGFSRAVCARETSERDLRTLCAESPIEIEAFVHGAICVSCSGQCLMSAMLGGRSGNRGECAQPCRMSYGGSYPLGMKDMCLAPHVPKLIDMGVASLKIEGRMKSPSYVYGVCKIYRKLLDERRAATPAEISELEKLFSRGGFTDGYFTENISPAMLGVRSDKNIADTRSREIRIPEPGSPRLPEIRIEQREKPEIPQKVVSLGRKPGKVKPENTARFVSASAIPQTDFFSHIYLPLGKFDPRADGVLIPAVIFDSELDDAKRKLEYAASHGAKHAMIANIGHFGLAKEFGLTPHGDFRLNVFNSICAKFLSELPEGGLNSILLSPELILAQIRDIDTGSAKKGAIVYGRIPLMLLQKPIGKRELTDGRGAKFPVVTEYGRDVIVNSVPTYMADYSERLDAAGIEERHFVFTTEQRGDVLKAIYAYEHKLPSKDSIRRIK